VLQVRLVVVVLPTFESCPFKAKRHELAVEDMNEDHGVVEKQTCETFLLNTITIVVIGSCRSIKIEVGV
jgi:hypothetical protein